MPSSANDRNDFDLSETLRRGAFHWQELTQLRLRDLIELAREKREDVPFKEEFFDEPY